MAYNNRGNAKKRQGDYQEAIKDYDEAIELDPNFAYAYNNRGEAKFELQDLSRGDRGLHSAIRIDPNYTEAYNNRERNAKAELMTKRIPLKYLTDWFFLELDHL